MPVRQGRPAHESDTMSDLILVIDDELTYAQMLSDLLADHGFQAEFVTDPREALERLHEQSFALIVSDFKMPEVDGAQFLVEARRIVPHLPVIMVSGLMTTPDLLKVANIGVTLVLEKPFNVDVFIEHVKRFVRPDAKGDAGAGSESSGSAREVVYPSPLRYLVDDSTASQEFITRLWRAIDSGARHVLLKLPPGGEFSELVKEATAWRRAPGVASFHFSMLELNARDVRQTIWELATAELASPVIAVTLPDGARFDPNELRAFVEWVESEATVRGHFRFLYALPLDLGLDSLLVDLEEAGLKEAVAGPLIMAPLRERLVDLAGYMGRFLETLPRANRRSLEPEAAGVLLQYGWPGNHRELLSVLRRAFNMTTGSSVRKEHIEAAIRSKHGETISDGLRLNLESFLLLEQRRYLREHLSPDSDLKTLAEVTGIGLDRLQPGRRPEDQPLLFPELLVESDEYPKDDDGSRD